eukprot:819241-Prymnesium_polylepis.1
MFSNPPPPAPRLDLPAPSRPSCIDRCITRNQSNRKRAKNDPCAAADASPLHSNYDRQADERRRVDAGGGHVRRESDGSRGQSGGAGSQDQGHARRP